MRNELLHAFDGMCRVSSVQLRRSTNRLSDVAHLLKHLDQVERVHTNSLPVTHDLLAGTLGADRPSQPRGQQRSEKENPFRRAAEPFPSSAAGYRIGQPAPA